MGDDTGDGRRRDRAAEMQLGRNIAQRLEDFARAVIRLSARLPKDATGRHVVIQMVRSATGAGSNYEEARAAESRADFVHKTGVALKELREARYWVALVQKTGWVESDLPIVSEANELAAILGASVRTAAHVSSEAAACAERLLLQRATGDRTVNQCDGRSTAPTGNGSPVGKPGYRKPATGDSPGSNLRPDLRGTRVSVGLRSTHRQLLRRCRVVSHLA